MLWYEGLRISDRGFMGKGEHAAEKRVPGPARPGRGAGKEAPSATNQEAKKFFNFLWANGPEKSPW